MAKAYLVLSLINVIAAEKRDFNKFGETRKNSDLKESNLNLIMKNVGRNKQQYFFKKSFMER